MFNRLKAALDKRATRAELIKACQWAGGRETGLSSLGLMQFYATGVPNKSYPRDGGDLKRCIEMLKFTGWINRISRAAEMGPQWKRLAAKWPEIMRLYSAVNWNDDSRYFVPRDPRFARKNASAKSIREYEEAKAAYDALPSSLYFEFVRGLVQ